MNIMKSKLMLIFLLDLGVISFISGQIIVATAIMAGISLYINKLNFAN